MKIYIYSFAIFAVLVFAAQRSSAQCDLGTIYTNCINLVNNYTYVKTLNIEPEVFKKDSLTVEYTYLFTKGTTYMLTICDNNANGHKMLLDLYDSRRQKVATNFDQQSKKYFVVIIYPCGATGMYHLRYSFQNNTPSCGVSIVGIKK